jgi:hypothetical protein
MQPRRALLVAAAAVINRSKYGLISARGRLSLRSHYFASGALSQFVIMQPQLTAAARTCHSTLAILFLSSSAFHPKWYINYFYGVLQSGTPVFDCVLAAEIYK